jgi:hypothetical protein
MPLSDPIIDEIHAIRDALARASGNDLQKIAEAARSRQKASGRQGVKPRPKRARTAKNAS